MNNDPFSLPREVDAFMQTLPSKWCLAGGWALDLYLNEVTREHLDVDLCVIDESMTEAVAHFLERDWRVEAKKGRGFYPVAKMSQLENGVSCFFTAGPEANFWSSYLTDRGDRKLKHSRERQHEMDYADVFLHKVDDGYLLFETNNEIRRPIEKALLIHQGIPCLAPELVFLYKSEWPKPKDIEDLDRVWPRLDHEQRQWFTNAMTILHPSHAWFDLPELSNFKSG